MLRCRCLMSGLEGGATIKHRTLVGLGLEHRVPTEETRFVACLLHQNPATYSKIVSFVISVHFSWLPEGIPNRGGLDRSFIINQNSLPGLPTFLLLLLGASQCCGFSFVRRPFRSLFILVSPFRVTLLFWMPTLLTPSW